MTISTVIRRLPVPSAAALLLAAALLSTAAPQALRAADTEVEIVEIQFRTAVEVVPLVEPLLSPQGSAAADPRTNALIVVDEPAYIQRVRSFLSGYDQPGKQVSVRVRFSETRLAERAGVAAAGRVSGEGWQVGVGRPRFAGDGVSVRARSGSRRQSGHSEHFIRVMSGSTAYIWAGQEIPYTERWVDLCRRHGAVVETVTYKRVESGFDVRPTVHGGSATIEVTPRIAMQGRGRRDKVIRFAAAATTLTVPLNEWVSIGGTDSDSHEVTRAILSTGTRSRNAALNIELRVEQ